jgi:hypothetical protein
VGQAAQGNRAHLLRISSNGEAHRARKEGDVTPEERAEKIVSHDELLAGVNAATKGFLRDWIAETIELAEAAAVARERERCAKIAESLPWTDDEMNYCTRERIAEAIRASKEQQ